MGEFPRNIPQPFPSGSELFIERKHGRTSEVFQVHNDTESEPLKIAFMPICDFEIYPCSFVFDKHNDINNLVKYSLAREH